VFLIALSKWLCHVLAPVEDRYYFMATIMLGFAAALLITR